MIIIGGPIYKRAWILDKWFECIEKQDWGLDKVGFVFEAVHGDTETLDKLFDWHSRHPEVSVFDVNLDRDKGHVDHGEGGRRRWGMERYQTMVRLRNNLLQKVRVHAPDRFFSLDSDILLENPKTLSELYEITELDSVDAVSPLMYMTPEGTRFPSTMTWHTKPGGFAVRKNDYPIGSLFKTDVIMAAKMMTPDVYNNTRYVLHKQGEDLGWSTSAAMKGFDLYCASHIYCPHIMSKQRLHDYLNQGDPRNKTFMVN